MWNLIIGIVFIIGGLSGGMALRGTQSGLALAGLGVILCIWGGVQLASSAKQKKQAERRVSLLRRPAGAPLRKGPPAPTAPPGAAAPRRADRQGQPPA